MPQGNVNHLLPIFRDTTSEAGEDDSNMIKVLAQLSSLTRLNCNNGFLQFLAKGGVPHKLPINLNCMRYLLLDIIDFGFKDEVCSVLCLIRSSPNLQSLQITTANGSAADMLSATQFLRAEKENEIPLCRLDNVTMRGFTCWIPEMEFLKLLLLAPTELRRLEIHFAHHFSEVEQRLSLSLIMNRKRIQSCSATADSNYLYFTKDPSSSSHSMLLMATRSPAISHWLHFLSNHHLEELTLQFPYLSCFKPVPNDLFTLDHLRHLCLVGAKLEFPSTFEGFSRLVRLDTEAVYTPDNEEEAAAQFLKAQQNCELTLSHLENVKINGLFGSEPEMEFMKLLLSAATTLMKLEVRSQYEGATEEGSKMLKALVKFRRASAKAEIIFQDPAYNI
ncbi:UNVERIFIED_CONTAM: hypothetical protein Slati_2595200 [Sesamum latifolium]|uniref:FBD domain-containing protein n=1 Tax=Sesamum latifolium TaxID=2727402 RepID=A0AAW2VSA5_9LAMI